ncbi:MAG: hypothetical protein L6V80_07480 [Bacteroidales bacterium]|nr:MAG: hypothetical protein L6V80_07480 [Bacteroidales bacterium]
MPRRSSSWLGGEDKAEIVRKVVEGDATPLIPASMLQNHPNIEAVVDDPAADCLTAKKAPWLVGPCNWTPRLVRKAVVWLCGVVKKPILKLTYKGLYRKLAGSAARCRRYLVRRSQYQGFQRPAAYDYRLAGRQTQC